MYPQYDDRFSHRYYPKTGPNKVHRLMPLQHHRSAPKLPSQQASKTLAEKELPQRERRASLSQSYMPGRRSYQKQTVKGGLSSHVRKQSAPEELMRQRKQVPRARATNPSQKTSSRRKSSGQVYQFKSARDRVSRTQRQQQRERLPRSRSARGESSYHTSSAFDAQCMSSHTAASSNEASTCTSPVSMSYYSHSVSNKQNKTVGEQERAKQRQQSRSNSLCSTATTADNSVCTSPCHSHSAHVSSADLGLEATHANMGFSNHISLSMSSLSLSLDTEELERERAFANQERQNRRWSAPVHFTFSTVDIVSSKKKDLKDVGFRSPSNSDDKSQTSAQDTTCSSGQEESSSLAMRHQPVTEVIGGDTEEFHTSILQGEHELDLMSSESDEDSPNASSPAGVSHTTSKLKKNPFTSEARTRAQTSEREELDRYYNYEGERVHYKKWGVTEDQRDLAYEYRVLQSLVA